MTRPFAVVDLFSGPGGLGEGFSACRGRDGNRFYRCLLSVEKEASAHRTLRLRALYWAFGGQAPDSYYDWLNRETGEPDWESLYPDAWRVARRVATHLELGSPDASALLEQRIDEIREEYGDRTVLLGGPPCQAYSLAGRAQETRLSDAAREENRKRASLHEEYAKALGRLRPAAFVMENVKGILSAIHEGQRIFPKILRGLEDAGGTVGAYRVFALTPPSSSLDGAGPSDFVVRAENHGVPQARHRVFVVGLRADLADSLPELLQPCLMRCDDRVTANDVIGVMAPMRSGLSRKDSPERWQREFQTACIRVRRNRPRLPPSALRRFHAALRGAREHADRAVPFGRSATAGTEIPGPCPSELASWLTDPRLERLPNNNTRGHMPTDLARYVFAASFAAALGRSPKAADFPAALSPRHRNWRSGRFADRFRVQVSDRPATTITSHISKDGHYFIHPDPAQCRSLTVREAARLQTFPDNYVFLGTRTEQYVQVGNAVPPFLARQIAQSLVPALEHWTSMRQASGTTAHRSWGHGDESPISSATGM